MKGELRWDPPATATGTLGVLAPVGAITSLVAGGVMMCMQQEWHVLLAGCVVGELGQLRRSFGTVAASDLHQAALYAGGGVGARVEVPLPARLYAQVAADVLVARKFSGSTAMTTGSIGGAAGGLGAGLGLSF